MHLHESNRPGSNRNTDDTMLIHENNTSTNNQLMSPIQRMKNLATQLGECCLTTDLTCLIKQRRDFELESAAKIIAKSEFVC